MLNVLYLDDDPSRHQQFDYPADRAWTAQEAVKLLSQNKYDLVSLDHDLATEHYQDFHQGELALRGGGTGYDVAVFIEQMEEQPPWVNVHSFNPSGAARMIQALRKCPRVTRLMTGELRKLLDAL